MPSFALSDNPSFKDTMPFASKQKTGITQFVVSFKSITHQTSPFYTLGPFSHVCLQLHRVLEAHTYFPIHIWIIQKGNRGLSVILLTLQNTRFALALLCIPDNTGLKDQKKFWQNSLQQVWEEKHFSLLQRTTENQAWLVSMAVQDAQGRPHSINTTKSPA